MVDVHFLKTIVVDGRQRQQGEVARLDDLLATSLIDNAIAVPVGGEPRPELRPARGWFARSPRR